MKTEAAALKQLRDLLEILKIPYAIVGSLASSARGIPRSTLDADLIAAITVPACERLASSLGPEWYADRQQMTTAVSAGRSFNLIYQPTFVKFDIFPTVEEFHFVQLERATEADLQMFGETVRCRVATAEDTLLYKLRWYREGGEVSERQWSDIQGILAINPQLDFDYVNLWAARLRVSGLLARALQSLRAKR